MDTASVRQRAAYKYVIANRNYRRARERALTRLSQLHKEQYLELLAQEKDRDVSEGKAWRITDPAFNGSSGDSVAPNTSKPPYYHPDYPRKERDKGGEA